MPSSSETFGHVVLEAMASGLATVAAAAGGPLDTVQPGETGLLFDPARPQMLCAALVSLIERSDWRRDMGQRARAIIEEGRWSWAAATADLRRYYTQLCDAPSSRAASVLSVGRGGRG